MAFTKIEGILPALVTPFLPNGEVDVPSLRRYVLHLVGQGVHGLFVTGSYGSGPLMSPEERLQVARVVVETAEGRAKILFHIGFADTKTTISMAREATALEVDAVACVTPYYYRHTREAVLGHYRRIIDATKLPVLLYNNPKYAHYSATPDDLAELAEYGLAGVKDSSADMHLFTAMTQSVSRSDFSFVIGSQTQLVPAMRVGASGCVSGLSNAFPRFIIEIYDLCRQGDFERAAALQEKANVLRKLTGDGIPVPFYHAVMDMQGVSIGVPRLPFEPLGSAEVARIRMGLEELKLL